MTKTVSLNEYTYSTVAVLAGKLSTIAEKPVPLGVAIHMAAGFFDFLLLMPDVQKALKDKVFSKMISPEEFDRYWDEIFKTITKEGSM